MITQNSPKEQEEWLVQKGIELKQEEDKEDNAILAQSRILYEVWAIWDSSNNPQGKSLTNESKWQWGYDFYAWAKAYTKRRAGPIPSKTTIDNKITIYRDYIAQETIEAPAVVYIPKRDEFGKLVDPDLADENAWESIEPDFNTCDYGKLLVARGSANRHEMSPDAWSALFDPYASVSTLKEALGKNKENNQTNEPEDKFYLLEEDGIIYGCNGQGRKAVLQVIWDNEGDELFQRTLCHVLKAIGVHVPLGYQK